LRGRRGAQTPIGTASAYYLVVHGRPQASHGGGKPGKGFCFDYARIARLSAILSFCSAKIIPDALFRTPVFRPSCGTPPAQLSALTI
jgi:hypothetical protein